MTHRTPTSIYEFIVRARLCWVLAGCAIQLAWATNARCDDFADEADFRFKKGTRSYEARDFETALDQFLVCNRLVPNRNVLFNIARTYEQLREFPNAYRYYLYSLDGETNAKAVALIEGAVARLKPLIAIIHVETDPPGATLYLNRKDLGPLGTTPRTIGLAAGTYAILTELTGHDPSHSQPVRVEAGNELTVKLKLHPILGTVAVEGESSRGAEVHVESENSGAVCVSPCRFDLPPGRHLLFLTKDDFQTTELAADVPVRTTVAIRPTMVPKIGTLVVNSDIRDAIVEIDGSVTGFTPSVVNFPVGTHHLRVSHTGYRPWEQTVILRANETLKVDVQLPFVEEVTAASRTTETVEEAPSSVTIITGQELRSMAYPTIAEALRGTRGIYLTDDRHFDLTMGVRGISRIGDFGNRVLVLVDGQSTNDDRGGASYIGYNARADIDDIERIELIRGPGSALYGTGAFLGVVNLVTRSRDAPTHAEVNASTAQNGVAHGRGTVHVKLGLDTGIWTSVAGAYGSGQDISLHEFTSNQTPPVVAGNLDHFKTGTVNGRLWYKDFTVQWLLNGVTKTLQSALTETNLNNYLDLRNRYSATRGFVEARFEPKLSKSVQLFSRAQANLFKFEKNGVSNREKLPTLAPSQSTYDGYWLGLEQRVVWTPTRNVRITFGGEGQRHFDAHQTKSLGSKVKLDRSDPYWVGAGYFVADLSPVRSIKLSAGARFDYYGYPSQSGASFNPRIALIARPHHRGTFKVIAGKAFRAPSLYELFYLPTPNPKTPLVPEDLYSGEFEYTHHFSTTLSGTVATYANYMNDLVMLVGDQQASYYTNSQSPIMTVGGEVVVRREWRNGWSFSATYSLQASSYLNKGAGGAVLLKVPNSPNHMGSLKASAAIFGRTLVVASRLTVESSRMDRYDQKGEPAHPTQQSTDTNAIWDIIFSGELDKLPFRYSVGLYNAFDWRYTNPLSASYHERDIIQRGRTFLASATVTF